MRFLILTTIAVISLVSLSHQANAKVDPLQQAFNDVNVDGALVLLNDSSGEQLTNNSVRSQQRYIPASTFKIPNSLLLLEAGLVKDEHTQFVWDGVKRDYSSWNRDHNFASAMKYSVVPIYQKLALALGEDKMSKGVRLLNYGNKDISGGLDSFWLDGELAISATEQVQFLQRLYHNQLPVSERSQRIVKTMMLNEANSDWVLRAKTGYGVRQNKKIGWWVGWIEKEDNTYFFAMNMDLDNTQELPYRQAIVRQALKNLGLM
ncbi:class D beta-lactamase [Shewanella mesophila]|uniref:class D beta-lactamase n=1 Tax=Shewanella mesophila TaxID=2864208 RepID=UPI001C65AE38|nr:class D beta-lactamase [Shewanella mesophila]QYJ85721.1 class D beta-lactamase [Shewanella mesophila]